MTTLSALCFAGSIVSFALAASWFGDMRRTNDALNQRAGRDDGDAGMDFDAHFGAASNSREERDHA